MVLVVFPKVVHHETSLTLGLERRFSFLCHFCVRLRWRRCLPLLGIVGTCIFWENLIGMIAARYEFTLTCSTWHGFFFFPLSHCVNFCSINFIQCFF